MNLSLYLLTMAFPPQIASWPTPGLRHRDAGKLVEENAVGIVRPCVREVEVAVLRVLVSQPAFDLLNSLFLASAVAQTWTLPYQAEHQYSLPFKTAEALVCPPDSSVRRCIVRGS